MAGYQIYRALQNAAQERASLPDRRASGAIDVSRTTPTQLPDALRAASERAFLAAADPLNQLDHNPYIGDLWAIVGDEFQALARALDRRFAALFDGQDARHASPHLRSWRGDRQQTV